MDAVEKQALKDLAHLLVDKELDVLLKDLIAKLPATYAPLIGVIEAAALPALISAIDAKIESL